MTLWTYFEGTLERIRQHSYNELESDVLGVQMAMETFYLVQLEQNLAEVFQLYFRSSRIKKLWDKGRVALNHLRISNL